jgi:hypothetical protein
MFVTVKGVQLGETVLKMNLTLGDPRTSINPDNVLKIGKLIRPNRRITVLELSQEVGINVGSVEEILHNELKVSKVAQVGSHGSCHRSTRKDV